MKTCKNCYYLSEDWAAGTGDYFCGCPNTAFDPGEKLDLAAAENCDFYEYEGFSATVDENKKEIEWHESPTSPLRLSKFSAYEEF